MSPIFKWDSNIRGKRRVSLKKRECERKIYIYAGCCIRNILVFLFFVKLPFLRAMDVLFAPGTNFSRLLKIAKVYVYACGCICIKVKEEKVGRARAKIISTN